MISSKKCSFCNKTVQPGNGIMLVRMDGSIFWFCSSKCRKNSLNLKRDARKLKWTAFHIKQKIVSKT